MIFELLVISVEEAVEEPKTASAVLAEQTARELNRLALHVQSGQENPVRNG